MALARPVPRRPPRELSESLTLLALRTRPFTLARETLLPVAPPFAELLGAPGLYRGGTIVVHGGGVPGATSLLLGLLAGPSAYGAWCAVVGAPELGLVAAGERGVALDRLVLIPDPGQRLVPVVGALLDGCDVVCVRLSASLAAFEARRLAARARERRAVLLVATGGTASIAASLAAGAGAGRGRGLPGGGWSETPDVRLAIAGSRFGGIERGGRRIESHLVEVVATRRRAVPEELRRWLWLPGEEGQVALAAEEPIVTASLAR